MENSRDPRIQIHADLNEVQKEIEKAAEDRKDEIKQEMKDHKKTLKDEAKDLKQEAKDNYKDYKEYKKDSNDPVADEKIATAKKASKVVTKSIDLDYQDTKDQIDMEADERMESIDRMFDDSQETVDAHNERSLRNAQIDAVSEPLITGKTNAPLSDNQKGYMGNQTNNINQKDNMRSNRPDYEIRDTLITDDASDSAWFIHKERDLRDEDQIRRDQPGMMDDNKSFGNKC